MKWNLLISISHIYARHLFYFKYLCQFGYDSNNAHCDIIGDDVYFSAAELGKYSFKFNQLIRNDGFNNIYKQIKIEQLITCIGWKNLLQNYESHNKVASFHFVLMEMKKSQRKNAAANNNEFAISSFIMNNHIKVLLIALELASFFDTFCHDHFVRLCCIDAVWHRQCDSNACQQFWLKLILCVRRW